MIESAACFKALIENQLLYSFSILSQIKIFGIFQIFLALFPLFVKKIVKKSHEFIGIEKEYEKIFPINDLMLAEYSTIKFYLGT